ncbi:MAG: hypothetical protein ACLT38_06295 [Akkermansia sp.]
MSDDDIRILVKEWLQSQNRKSYQLAEEIGIRPQTFYAQMSVRKISANTKKALSRIIPGLIPDSDLNPPSIRKNVTRKTQNQGMAPGSRQNTPMACGTMPRFRPHRTYLVYCTR